MKKLLILAILLTGCTANLGAKVDVVKYEGKVPVAEFKKINWTQPTTDQGWAEDVKKESLEIRSDVVLDEMLVAHQTKLNRVLDELYYAEKYPDAKALELEKSLISMGFTGVELQNELAKQIQEHLDYWRAKAEKLSQSVIRMEKEKELRATDKVDRTNTIKQ